MDQDEFQLKVVESLGRLEAKIETLTGNGQPGRVGKLEDQVDDLRKARWTIGGLMIGIATTVSAIIHFMFKY